MKNPVQQTRLARTGMVVDPSALQQPGHWTLATAAVATSLSSNGAIKRTRANELARQLKIDNARKEKPEQQLRDPYGAG